MLLSFYYLFAFSIECSQNRAISSIASKFSFHNLILSSKMSISSIYQESPLILSIPTTYFKSISIQNAHFSKIASPIFYGSFNQISISDSIFREIKTFNTNSQLGAVYLNSQEYFKNRISNRLNVVDKPTISFSNTIFESICPSSIQNTLNGGAVYAKNCKIDFTFCLFIKNEASNGAAIAVENGCKCILHQTNFSDNYAEIYGGAIYGNHSDDIQIYQCTIRNCRSKNSGGVYFNSVRSLKVRQCIFCFNSAQLTGGSIVIENMANANIIETYFMNNECNQSSDGSVLSIDFNSFVTFTQCSFDQNKGNNQFHISGNISSDKKVISFVNCCLSSNPIKNKNILIDSKSKFISKCPTKDATIPEIQEMFNVYIEVHSALTSKGFIASILIVIGASILVLLYLPYLFIGSE